VTEYSQSYPGRALAAAALTLKYDLILTLGTRSGRGEASDTARPLCRLVVSSQGKGNGGVVDSHVGPIRTYPRRENEPRV